MQLQRLPFMLDNGGVKRKAFRAKSTKVRIRGKDDAPITMDDFKHGLYELARWLQPYAGYRIKSATLYLTVVDDHGDEVTLIKTGQKSIFPYECAADRIDPS
jgi:hypothetical protein